MNGKTKKLFALFLALTVAATLALPSAAFAATKTVKGCDFQTSTKVAKKKATTVKKGTTKLNVKKGQGYVKFKATKTKKYSFTFSKVTSKGFSSNAFVEVQSASKNYPSSITFLDVKTKGGKTNTLWLTANGYSPSGTGTYKTLPSRTAKVKLKKGQWVYFYIYNGANGNKTSMQLKIK